MDASWQPDAVNELKQQAYQRRLGDGVDLSQEDLSAPARHDTSPILTRLWFDAVATGVSTGSRGSSYKGCQSCGSLIDPAYQARANEEGARRGLRTQSTGKENAHADV
ncbi:MAG: hypothetical protein OSA88_13655 [Acidimicrobiales bacterium]|nr:hypothetical protein [Acidimicrobiales bacterium]